MSPLTAPMRDATRPSAPGRSGTRTRINVRQGLTFRTLPTAAPRFPELWRVPAPARHGAVRRIAEVTRLGVLGGTFDPVHHAHVVVAVDVRDALALDELVLVPAGDPWQKR